MLPCKGWSTSGKSRDGIEVFFVQDATATKSREDVGGKVHELDVCVGSTGEDRHSFTDL